MDLELPPEAKKIMDEINTDFFMETMIDRDRRVSDTGIISSARLIRNESKPVTHAEMLRAMDAIRNQPWSWNVT